MAPTKLYPILLGLLLWVAACEGCDADPLGHVPQPGSIQGRVCDPGNEAAGIYGARVYVVVDSGDGVLRERGTVSDAEGAFLLEGVPAGTYTVHVERGSFRTELSDVMVEEEQTTDLDPGACIAPTEVTIAVYEGHDRVQEVLERLGYVDYTLFPTFHLSQDRDDNTPSWLPEAFGDYASFAEYDILFINCGAHAWALEGAPPDALALAMENLRRFVAEGGSIYFSDWSYDVLEALYPDAVDWMGDDAVYTDAQAGLRQPFIGNVLDAQMVEVLGNNRATLRYEQNRIAIPEALGEGTRALITADIDVSIDGTPYTQEGVPVLLEHQPTLLDPQASPGRVIFTTFHNGSSNTSDMDELLRAIVYSL